MAYDKVVDSTVLDAGLKQIADAIREKGGTTDNLAFPVAMAEAIAAIETAGAGNGAKISYGSYTPTEDQTVLSNDPSTSFHFPHGLGCIPTCFVMWHDSASWANSINLYVYNHNFDTSMVGKYSTPMMAGYHKQAGTKSMIFLTGIHSQTHQESLINDSVIALTTHNYMSDIIYMRAGLTYNFIAFSVEE